MHFNFHFIFLYELKTSEKVHRLQLKKTNKTELKHY